MRPAWALSSQEILGCPKWVPRKINLGSAKFRKPTTFSVDFQIHSFDPQPYMYYIYIYTSNKQWIYLCTYIYIYIYISNIYIYIYDVVSSTVIHWTIPMFNGKNISVGCCPAGHWGPWYIPDAPRVGIKIDSTQNDTLAITSMEIMENPSVRST